jgi:hypothetical protein
LNDLGRSTDAVRSRPWGVFGKPRQSRLAPMSANQARVVREGVTWD